MIVAAFFTAEGIQLHRQINDQTLAVEHIKPGHPGWDDALAAVETLSNKEAT